MSYCNHTHKSYPFPLLLFKYTKSYVLVLLKLDNRNLVSTIGLYLKFKYLVNKFNQYNVLCNPSYNCIYK